MTSPDGIGAVFLDRDGTVSEEAGYMYDPGRLEVFPWTGGAIRRLNDSGIPVVLVTNQSGVARGYFTETMVEQVHDRLRLEIARSGAHLDAVYFCPHHPETGCECRKPRPGMLLRAGEELGIDLRRSYMIGDRYFDVEAGREVGARTILLLTGDGRVERAKYADGDVQPDYVARDLDEAVGIVLRNRFPFEKTFEKK